MNIRITIAFLVLLFLPQELSFFIGTLRLEVYRVVLILIAIPTMIAMVKRGIKGFEFFLCLYVVLASASFLIHEGAHGIEPAGVLLLELLVTYFLGVTFVDRYGLNGIRKWLRVLALCLLLLIPFAILEAVTGFRSLHVVASKISGQFTLQYVSPDYYRNGVYRASTVFSHPILYSIIASSLVIVLYSLFKKKKAYMLGSMVAVVSSMSSVGFIVIIIQASIFLLDYLYKRVPITKQMSIYGGLILFLVIHFGSNRGFFTWLAVNSALSPWNAYVRLLQWEHAWDDILRNPLIGIGHGDWTRPSWLPGSIDAYWLVAALVNGLPAAFCLILFWGLLLWKLLRFYSKTGDRILLAFSAVIISFAFAGTTVHFFDKVPPFLYFFLGISSGYLSTVMINNSRRQ